MDLNEDLNTNEGATGVTENPVNKNMTENPVTMTEKAVGNITRSVIVKIDRREVDEAMKMGREKGMRTFRDIKPLVLGRSCPFECEVEDHSSKGRSLDHYRLNHQALRCKFVCPAEQCLQALTPEINNRDSQHLQQCFEEGFPSMEFWELENITWEAGPYYEGEINYMDPYALFMMLVQPVTGTSKWILKMNTCAFIYEQLRMLL